MLLPILIFIKQNHLIASVLSKFPISDRVIKSELLLTLKSIKTVGEKHG